MKVVFLSVKLHSGAFEADRYEFLISVINKKKIKLHFTLNSHILCDNDFGDFSDDEDNEIDRTDQICNFLDVRSFVLI